MTTRSPLHYLALWVSRRPRLALALVLITVAPLAVSAARVGVVIDIFGSFQAQGERVANFEEFAETFGVNDNSLVAIVELSDDQELDRSALAAIDELTNTAAASPGVVSAISITNVNVFRPFGTGDPLLNYAPPFAQDLVDVAFAERLSLARGSRLGARQLISADGRVLLIVAQLDPELDVFEEQAGPAEAFRTRLLQTAEPYSEMLRVGVAGLTFTIVESVERSTRDLTTLLPLSLALMATLTWLFFRSLWAVVGIFFAIVSSVVATIGIMGLAGDNLTQFSSSFPVLLIGATVATGTHVVHRYLTARSKGSTPADACRSTIETVAGVSLLCSVTNALGFLSLLVASIAALRELGVYLAIGMLFCFCYTAVIIPAVLQVTDARPQAYYQRASTGRSPRGDKIARSYATWASRPGVALAVTMAGLVGVLYFATTNDATANYTAASEFPPDSELGAANALIDSQLEGTIPVEISLRGAPGSWADPQTLRVLNEFDIWLRVHEGLWTVGIPSVLAEMEVLGVPFPTTSEEVETLISSAMDAYPEAEPFVRQALTDDRSWTRLTAFRPESGSNEYLEMVERVEAEARSRFEGTNIEVTVTGTATVAFFGVDVLTEELVEALTLAVAMIVAAIAVGLRSIRVAAVALLPNAAPIAFGFGIFMATHEFLDPLVAAIFAIILGFAADDTVHLTNAYLRYRDLGVAPRKAVIEAFTDLWRAMFTSTAVLLAAFAVLMVSTFHSTRLIGWFGSLLLLLALAADIVFGVAGISLLALFDTAKKNRRERAGELLVRR